jgi:hypothetical protein
MPPRKAVKPEAVEDEVVEQPEETLAVPSDSDVPEADPEVPADADPAEEVPNAEEVPADPEADAPEAEEEGVEVGFSPGEEVISERLRDDAVLVVVTNFGRKVEIDPDGTKRVITGPPLEVVIPAEPVPTPVGVLGPKPELG